MGIVPLFVVIWILGRVKKKNVIARSSAETKYKVMLNTVCELMWIENLLQERFSLEKPMTM